MPENMLASLPRRFVETGGSGLVDDEHVVKVVHESEASRLKRLLHGKLIEEMGLSR